MNLSNILESLKESSINLSIGEKLFAGLSIAILSMILVFIVLGIIALLINLLQLDRNTKIDENSKLDKNKIVKANVIEDEEIDMMKDSELVSVIIASILASKDENTNIVVRRIVRTNNQKSNWEKSINLK